MTIEFTNINNIGSLNFDSDHIYYDFKNFKTVLSLNEGGWIFITEPHKIPSKKDSILFCKSANCGIDEYITDNLLTMLYYKGDEI